MPRAPLLLVALLLVALPALPSDMEMRRLSVTPMGEGYACEAEMAIPVTPSLAWEVMTDFDSMARWVPNLRSSRVLSREGRVVQVEQVGVLRFGPIAFEFALERRMELDAPRTIAAVQTRGTLKSYRSVVTIAPEKDAVSLTYRVEVEPGLLLGAVLTKDYLEHELRGQFAAIAAEMARRRPVRATPAAGR